MRAHPSRSPLRLLGGAALWALLALGCAGAGPRAAPPGEPILEGKVSLGGRGVDGAEVLLLSPDFHLDPGAPPAARGETDGQGDFRLSAPRGSYLLLARRQGEFSYFGRNPVHVSGALTGLHLPLVPARPAVRDRAAPGEEGIRGRVLEDGAPAEGARVFVYLDADRGLRGPGYAVSDPTGEDGRFAVPLPPGTYFVATRLRPRGGRTGALEPGDRFGVFAEFPVSLRAGETVTAEIETVEVPVREQMARFRGRFARLTGRVVDPEGRPVEGLRACLYEVPQMLDRPSVVSGPTGRDGRFTLEAPLSGVFYLGAREALGGPPEPGERVGFYRGPRGPAVELSPGRHLEGLEVVIQVVP